MDNFEMTKTTVKATIVHDKECSSYTIFLDSAGGPIISASTIEDAKTKFAEAFKLSSAVRNLLYFAQVVKTNDEAKKDITKDTLRYNNPSIEYVEAELDSVC